MALDLPSTLTPSKLGKFVSCPLSFRYAYIERLPEPPTTYQLRGTLLHRVLQQLFGEGPAASRTRDRAQSLFDAAWSDALASGELDALGLDDKALGALRRESSGLLEHYFAIEDPTGVHPVGIELDLRFARSGLELRGIIDRLDRLDNGEYVVTDYKTGRAPRPEHARSAMLGVQFYAYLCEQTIGQRPSEVRLMYLRDQVVIVESPTDQTMRGLRQRALAVWAAIERGCSDEDFRPNPSALCRSCNFQEQCPAMAEQRLAKTA